MYCSVDDLIKRISLEDLTQLSDDDGDGEYDENIVNEAIEYAQNIIDGYVGKKYQVPLDPIPEIIKRIAVDLAIYWLYSRSDEIPEEIENRYKNQIKMLEDIAKGNISIGVLVIEEEGVYQAGKTLDERIFKINDIKNL